MKMNKTQKIIVITILILAILLGIFVVHFARKKQVAVEVSSSETDLERTKSNGEIENLTTPSTQTNTENTNVWQISSNTSTDQNVSSNNTTNTTQNTDNQNKTEETPSNKTETKNTNTTQTKDSDKETKTTNNNTNTTKNTTSTKSDNKSENKSSKKGVIYLTFDDGPSSTSTPKILDILKEENVKATFFILNYDNDKVNILKREAAEGHSIGIHGYSHDYKQIYKSDDAYMDNLNKLQNKIKDTLGVTSQITRFPGGSSNTISRRYSKGIMSRLTKNIQKAGYKYYDWNVDSDDAGSAKNKTQVYNNVTKGLSKNRSNVVLMHDFSGNSKTIGALKNIIEYGKENGYTFLPITYDSDLTVHHGVQN